MHAPLLVDAVANEDCRILMIRTGLLDSDIPFDRQQLADYLNVERTALSKELGRMQKGGLIRVKKNHFRLEP